MTLLLTEKDVRELLTMHDAITAVEEVMPGVVSVDLDHPDAFKSLEDLFG